MGQQLVSVPVVLKTPGVKTLGCSRAHHNNTLCCIQLSGLRIDSLSSELDGILESAFSHGSGHVFGL